MRISDLSSDVFSSDLGLFVPVDVGVSPLQFLSVARFAEKKAPHHTVEAFARVHRRYPDARLTMAGIGPLWQQTKELAARLNLEKAIDFAGVLRSEEHTSELQSLMRISYAVFCLKKKHHTKSDKIKKHTHEHNRKRITKVL